ncbi:MAG: hypothetical protein JOY93_06860 [Acidobacteriales bacterium]|nr:hypothetical protein [Terriglobales bacterium]
MRNVVLTACLLAVTPLTFAQTESKHLTSADAKNHIGETATVCGTVVDSKVWKYGIGGKGRPINLDLDQPEPNPVFYFVTFGDDRTKADDVAPAYKGKQVCVTGKVDQLRGTPFIMATEKTQISLQPGK